MLKVMTWNINGGYGLAKLSPLSYETTENLETLMVHIEALSPDVVCLQEVHVNTSRSQAREIAARLGYDHVFETLASESHIDGAYKLANAMLSRLPLTERRAVCLPRPTFELHLPSRAGGGRAALHDKYLQVARYGDVVLANTHLLPLHRFGSSYTSPEGMKLAREIEQVFLDHLEAPLVMCGDFNAPDLASIYPRLFATFGLGDALPHQASLPHSDSRVDYVLFSRADFTVNQGSITRTFNDHFPCMAVLETRQARQVTKRSRRCR